MYFNCIYSVIFLLCNCAPVLMDKIQLGIMWFCPSSRACICMCVLFNHAHVCFRPSCSRMVRKMSCGREQVKRPIGLTENTEDVFNVSSFFLSGHIMSWQYINKSVAKSTKHLFYTGFNILDKWTNYIRVTLHIMYWDTYIETRSFISLWRCWIVSSYRALSPIFFKKKDTCVYVTHATTSSTAFVSQQLHIITLF